jgi:hypothetical protein
MFEYPSMKNTKKAKFGESAYIFNKIDGSNFRAKWTRKHDFNLFGTRTQLVDESTDYWGNIVKLFNDTRAENLSKYFNDKTKADNIIVFSEFHGPNSFAGRHNDSDAHQLTVFDVYDTKLKSFMGPENFVNRIGDITEIPKFFGIEILNYELVSDVRAGKYDVVEGVICKGVERKGNFAGGVPMYKIKTMKYLDKLKEMFKDKWEDYAE